MKFKKGEKVIIVQNDIMEQRWPAYKKLIGKTLHVDEDTDSTKTSTAILENNKYRINFVLGCLRKYKIDNWKKEME